MRISLETRENFSTFLAARLVFATVLLGIAALFRAGPQSLWPYLALFLANTALSLGCWEWFHRKPPAKILRWFALTGAVVLDTLILRFSGGAHREFVFLYFFSIASAGTLTGLPGSLWTALLSATGVAWLYYGTSPAFMAEHTLKVLIYAVNFLLTAVLSSHIFAKLRDRERTHQRTLGELERMRLDTQAILNSLSTGVVVLDAEHRVLYSNPASHAILNLGQDAAAADAERLFAPETVVGEVYRNQIVHLPGSAGTRNEFLLPAANRPVGISVSPLYGSDGDRRGYIVLFADLTRIKETERAEREKERLADIGRLSRDLAHEIRNPLATVRGCVEVIKLSEQRQPEISPYLELALLESDRLNGLLRDFLLFAHLEPPHKKAGDLHAVIRSRVKRADAGLTVNDRLPESVPAEFDNEQITLVVETILLSLAEWADGHGEICIECGTQTEARVRFTLSGKGISAEIREAAFRPFSDSHRLSNGLALPTAMRAVHAHGGQLTLDSEPGVGTWFELAI